MRNIFVPVKRINNIKSFLNNPSKISIKLKEAMIDLRKETRQFDHKLQKSKVQ